MDIYFLPKDLLLRCSKCSYPVGTVLDLAKSELYCPVCKVWISKLELAKQVAMITNVEEPK